MILMYHNVGEAAGFNTVSVSALDAQLQCLAQQRLQVIPLPTYVARLMAGQSLKGAVALTFDDGYTSFYDLALPLLAHHSCAATLYVPTAHVGGANVWDDGALPIMGWPMLADTAAHPLVTVGAHSATHPRMRMLADADLHTEVRACKQALEDHLRMPCKHFSYPYGQLRDVDSRCVAAVAAAGFESACTTQWGRRASVPQQFTLPRIEVEPEDDISRFSGKISRNWHPRRYRQQAKNLLYQLGLRK